MLASKFLRHTLTFRVALVVVAIGGIIPSGLAHAAALPQMTESPTAGGQGPASQQGQAEDASASAEARITGRRVEVAGSESAFGADFANPDGSFTLDEHAQPVRVRRGNSWVPLSTTLTRGANGTISPDATTVGLTFSGGGVGPLAKLSMDSWTMSLSWPAPLPAPRIVADTATYPDVLPGVDLAVIAANAGFSERLVVKSRHAASDPGLGRIKFVVDTSGVALRAATDGSMSGVDGSGATVLSAAAPAMWDASSGPDGRARRHPVGLGLHGTDLVLRPDVRMLTGARTVFPVTIDPSFNAGRLNWTEVLQQSPDTSFWNGQHLDSPNDPNGPAMVGLDPAFGTDARALYQMNTSSINGKHILKATFQIKEMWSFSCTATGVQLWETGGIGSSTTWNSENSINTSSSPGFWLTKNDELSVAKGNENFGCNDGEVDFNATKAVVDVAARNRPNLTLGLRASNEGDVSSWKRFDTNPSLAITYNSVPNIPSNVMIDGAGCVQGSGRPFIGDTAPTLRATVSDPDAGTLLTAAFSWAPLGGTTNSTDVVKQTNVASGSQAIVAIPSGKLIDGSSYFIQVTATDGIDASPPSSQCEFTVDTARPASPPAVTSTDYPADGNFHGGVGQTGTFTLSAAGVTDVAGYQYGFADPPTTQVPAASLGGGATISATPPAVGLNTLFVRSVDRAGNLSDITHYVFLAGGPTGPVGAWAMDEGSGQTLSDGSGNGHTATLSGGTSWTSGHTGSGSTDRATTFDGATGAAATSGSVLDTAQSYTIAAWVRLTSTTHLQTAVSQSGSTSSAFFLQYDKNDNCWSLSLSSTDTVNPTGTRIVSGVAPQLGAWTHLAGVYDVGANTITLYINGVAVGSKTVAGKFNASGPLTIGRSLFNGAPADFWSGDIDDVQVWQRVVFPEEIASIANTSTLVGSWGLDEGSGIVAADSSGYRHDATLTPSDVTWTSGFDGLGAVHLGGTAGELDTAQSVVATDQSFSVVAWVRMTAVLPEDETAVSEPGTEQTPFALEFAHGPNRWAFTVTGSDTSNSTSTQALSVDPPAVGVWTHLVGVYDAGAHQVRLYVNGQLQSSVSTTPLWKASGSLVMGRKIFNGSLSSFFSGDLDDVSIYLGALSDADVVNLFNQ